MANIYDMAVPASVVGSLPQASRAIINVEGHTKYLGIFDDLEDAIRARVAAEKKYGFHPNHSRQQASEGAE